MPKRKPGEKTENLRRRPENVRYFYLVVGAGNLHTGCSYGGLQYVQKTDGPISRIFLSDLKNKTTQEVKESVDSFMAKWREHYNEPGWDYFAETPSDVEQTLDKALTGVAKIEKTDLEDFEIE